jgi:hypothetical protein
MDQMEVEVLKASKEWGETFDKIVAGRFEMKAFSFLSEDLISQSGEALIELGVLVRQQFIKLMILQDMLEKAMADKADSQGNIKLGVEGFKRNG